MRIIRFEYGFDAIFEYCRGITLQKVYDTDRDNNAPLAELYGLTEDERDHFVIHCLKFACDEVYLSLKRHSYGTEPYGFNVDDGNGNQIIYYDVMIGAVQDDMIKDYILQSIRNYSIAEWYKMKGHDKYADFHENEFNKYISNLHHYTKGNNLDRGNINISRRRGTFN
jgi:hypothetical protein